MLNECSAVYECQTNEPLAQRTSQKEQASYFPPSPPPLPSSFPPRLHPLRIRLRFDPLQSLLPVHRIDLGPNERPRRIVVVVDEVRGEEDGSVYCDRETAVPASDHDGDEDEAREGAKRACQRGVFLRKGVRASGGEEGETHGGSTEGEADGAVSGADFEHDGEDCEVVVSRNPREDAE